MLTASHYRQLTAIRLEYALAARRLLCSLVASPDAVPEGAGEMGGDEVEAGPVENILGKLNVHLPDGVDGVAGRSLATAAGGCK